MSMIYHVVEEKVTPFLVFKKYEEKEYVMFIFNLLNEEYPNTFFLSTNERN